MDDAVVGTGANQFPQVVAWRHAVGKHTVTPAKLALLLRCHTGMESEAADYDYHMLSFLDVC
jgi:hypothetical protein